MIFFLCSSSEATEISEARALKSYNTRENEISEPPNRGLKFLKNQKFQKQIRDIRNFRNRDPRLFEGWIGQPTRDFRNFRNCRTTFPKFLKFLKSRVGRPPRSGLHPHAHLRGGDGRKSAGDPPPGCRATGWGAVGGGSQLGDAAASRGESPRATPRSPAAAAPSDRSRMRPAARR